MIKKINGKLQVCCDVCGKETETFLTFEDLAVSLTGKWSYGVDKKGNLIDLCPKCSKEWGK